MTTDPQDLDDAIQATLAATYYLPDQLRHQGYPHEARQVEIVVNLLESVADDLAAGLPSPWADQPTTPRPA